MPHYKYYHRSEHNFFKLVVPPGYDILFIGLDGEQILEMLAPRRGVIITPNDFLFKSAVYECYNGLKLDDIAGTYDYIIIQHALSFCDDLGIFATQLASLCNPGTRVIIFTHNYLWKPLFRIAEKQRLKKPGGLDVMLSATDINNIMSASGFQLISTTRTMLFPLFAMGIGPLVNALAKLFPFFDWLKVNLFQKYRLTPSVPANHQESLTVCLTCRDEKENIEPLVKAIPQVADNQEILFVEGHSIDGTLEEIHRVKKEYKNKNIRVIGQPGKGQGDAIKEGFSNARGNIIILLEADMTSPPENIRFVYESMRSRHLEFIEGSRFIYPISKLAMPYLNQIGNWCFSFFFSWLFWRQITDVLSGIKAVRKDDFQKMILHWNSWGINDPFGDFELLFGAMRLGLKTGELPIHYQPRPYGESKTRVIYHGYILTKMAISAFLKFRG